MFFYNENALTDTLDWLVEPKKSNYYKSTSYPHKGYRGDGTNIVEVEGGYIFRMAVPGCSSDDVSVKLRENKITIKSESKLEHFEYENEYSLKITDKIDWKKIEAKVKHGILTLELPFAEEFDKSRTIL